MRLIDADSIKFRCTYNGVCTSSTKECKKCLDYCCDVVDIKNSPTAYDVEAVVAELEKSATDDDGLFVSDGSEPMIWKSKAIEIVRGKE